MKKFLIVSALALSGTTAFSQIDNGVPSATGKGGASTALLRNWDAIGINPANLGWADNYKFSVTVANFGLTAQSDAFQSKTLRNALISPNDTFNSADKQLYVKEFDSPNALNFQANVNWGAASFYFPKIGGFAIGVRDRMWGHVGLNQNASDLIFNGINAAVLQDTNTYHKALGQILDSTNISYLHYRELNFSYGRRIWSGGQDDAAGVPGIQIFGGFGVKYLWGFGSIDAAATGQTLTGHASLTTNYNVNYGVINNFTPEKTSLLFNAVGTGVAFDAGLSVILKNHFTLAASMTDMGSILFKNNMLVSSDTLVTPPDSTNTGLHSWNVGSQGSFAFADNGLFNYGPGSNFRTALPSRLRIGGGLKYDKFEAALDVVVPVGNKNLNLSKPYLALGGEYNFLGWLKVSAGFSGNPDLGWSVPMGVIFGLGGVVEIGVATGDVLTFVDKSKNPYLSVAVMAVRFNLKPMKKDNALPTS